MLFNLDILPVALAVAILSTALPYSLEIIALPKIPARTFGTLMSLEPAMAALSGMLFLGEHLSGVQWLALAAIIAASMGSALTIRPKTAPRKPFLIANPPADRNAGMQAG